MRSGRQPCGRSSTRHRWRGVISKDEAGYNKVQYLLVKLRRSGEIDYDSIVDNTRHPIQPTTFESPAEAS